MFWFILGMFSSVILCAVIRYLYKNQEDSKGYILVEKKSGLGGYMKEVHFVSLYYNGNNIYEKINTKMTDENHFFVPIKGNEKYLNRTMFRNTHLDGSVEYDHNGYYLMSTKDIKKAFENLKKENPQFSY